MEEIVLYLFKSALCLFLCYGIYYIFLKKETFFKFNRYFLLTGAFLSIIIPFINFSYTVQVTNPGFDKNLTFNIAKTNDMVFSYLQIGLLIYFVITCGFIFNYLMSLRKARRLVSGHSFKLIDNCKVIYTNQFQTSFSIFNYIFLDTDTAGSELERRLILEHEKAHVIQKHWLDIQIAQLVRITQWFNPIAWLYLNAVRQNHEYLADQTVLEAGTPGAVYRATLLNHSLQSKVFKLSSSFAGNNPFSRIDMMKKRASGETKKWSVLLLIPCISAIFFAFAKPDYQTDPEQGISRSAPALSRKKTKNTHGNVVPAATKASISTSGVKSSPPPIYVVNGIETKSIDDLDANQIESISVFKGESAISRFGDKGKHGVIAVTLKKRP